MKRFLSLVALMALMSVLLRAGGDYPMKSVVKISATRSIYNYQKPWKSPRLAQVTGSGAVIANHRILTVAHVVANAQYIEVKKENDPKPYMATVRYVSDQADLAILEVEDERFFEGTIPLALTEDVQLHDKVTTLGYPVGGEHISTTTGVVSRIEYSQYVWSRQSLLAIQIDAAINSGNSGGPVVNEKNELIGIAMMSRSNADNISYIVPAMVIETFLKDTEDGVVDGFGRGETGWQEIVHQAQRDFFGLGKRTGILIAQVDMNDTDTLKRDDIVLAVDGKVIADDGTIETRYGRIKATIALHTKQIGESVTLKIWRDKREKTVSYTIKRLPQYLNHERLKKPRYLLYGGLVFTPMTRNFVVGLYEVKIGDIALALYAKRRSATSDEPVATVNTIFPDPVNTGYKSDTSIVTNINGILIKNFRHLVQVLDGMETKYTRFNFVDRSSIILETAEAKKSVKRIMGKYGIPADRRVD